MEDARSGCGSLQSLERYRLDRVHPVLHTQVRQPSQRHATPHRRDPRESRQALEGSSYAGTDRLVLRIVHGRAAELELHDVARERVRQG